VLCEEPTTTHAYIVTGAQSSASSVVSTTASVGREASVTMPTGVLAGRCSSSIATALGSCQSRPRLRGL
jgi:ABC-type transporter Mla maintaining outer membrane lipid asymmetry permease subunit MlaE